MTVTDPDKAITAAWGRGAEHPDFPKYMRLVKTNFSESEKLRTQGVELNDLTLLYKRLEMFVDHIAPKETSDRLQFEIAWQEALRDSMEGIKNELVRQRNQAKLDTITGKKKLIIP